MGNTRFLCHNKDKSLASFSIYSLSRLKDTFLTYMTDVVYRYQCGWNERTPEKRNVYSSISFTQHTRAKSLSTYFCINYPTHARSRLMRYIERCPMLAHREFFLDALAADECIRAWQAVISRIRRELIVHVH
jgi:hypothetical protein